MNELIQEVSAKLLRVSPRSQWIMVTVRTSAGRAGFGEASLHFSENTVVAAVASIGTGLTGLGVAEALQWIGGLDPGDLITTSAHCALDQALHDLEAQRLEQPICRLLAHEPAKRLDVYANINRRTRDRSPIGFAASARDAVAAGFSALKIAPFDDLTPDHDRDAARPLLEAGFARMAAVRDAMGPDRRLLVDCHWRLSPGMIDPVVDACAALGVFWLETPYPEDDDRLSDIAQARRGCNARDVLLAGAELKIGRDAFEAMIAADCYDVLMPDMKYVGGYGEFMAVARSAEAAGVAISPHNPTGPICHAHSVQASAAIGRFLILEMQFDETPAFGEIVEGVLPMPADGVLDVPIAPGLGLRLIDDRMVALVDAG
jgi:galactonate dehydratase